MKPISSSDLTRFINLTSRASYDHFKKEEYRKLGRRILKQIATLLELKKGTYDIRWNPGGVAVSGDHTLHTDSFYLALHDNLGSGWFYYRTCTSRKDYTGGPNQNVYWTQLMAYGLPYLVERLKNI